VNTDIRVDVGFFTHRKTVKLIRRLGPEAAFALIRLWAYARTERPYGILKGMDTEDIAIASGWNGDNEKFFSNLVEVGFLDGPDENADYQLHNWEKRQPWAIESQKRSERATEMNKAKWEKHRRKTTTAIYEPQNAIVEPSTSHRTTKQPENAAHPYLTLPYLTKLEESKRPELTIELQEILANELHVKVILYNWDWSCLDKLDIPNQWVLDLYRSLFHPDIPTWAKKDRDWLLTIKAPLNLIKHYEKFKDQKDWQTKTAQTPESVLIASLSHGNENE